MTLSATGTFIFQDLGLNDNGTTDAQGLLIVPPSGAIGTFTATILDGASGADGDTTGTVQWSYSVDPGLVQYLGLGEQLVLIYELQIVDLDGNTLVRPITITITGTNDTPVITAVDVAETIAEDAGTNLVADGSLTFTDADIAVGGSTADTSTVTEALHALAWTGGTLSGSALTDMETALNAAFTIAGAGVASAANNGTVTWAFDLPQTAVDFLAAGETLTVTYRVTVTDDSGDSATNTATQDVTITITGTNDAPTLADVALTAVDSAGDDSFAD